MSRTTFNRWWPVTYDFGLIKAPIDAVLNTRHRQYLDHGSDCKLQELNQSLELCLKALEPLSFQHTKEMFLCTKFGWTAYFANGTRGSVDITTVADLDVVRAKAIVGDRTQVVADARAVIANPDIDIVVELIGGYGIARTLVMEAIAAGKHVVTANKALLAVHGSEIFAAAHAKGVMVGFEAAVAGGIPIIKALREGLTANRIEWIAGIINGTTNFILSEMRSKGLDFGTVLKEAQRLGYAEADPTFDIEGVDAAHKLTIMSAIAFGTPVQFERAHIEGITQLQAVDIRYAEQLGYRIKLLGITRRRTAAAATGGGEGIELRVHPTLVPNKRLIANVEGAMNAVLVQADAVGTTLYYGKGAGAEPTASAVVADLVDITRLHTADPDHRVPHTANHTLTIGSYEYTGYS